MIYLELDSLHVKYKLFRAHFANKRERRVNRDVNQ